MSKWKLRGCPRCAGDLYMEKDYDDCYERCLQCGYVRQLSGPYDSVQPSPLTARSRDKEKIAVAGIVH